MRKGVSMYPYGWGGLLVAILLIIIVLALVGAI